jgi:RND superfamily putative drug exporter
MFTGLGHFTYKRRWIVLVLGLVFLAASVLYGTSLFGKLTSGGFYDPAADSTQVMEAMHDKLGQDREQLIAVFTSKDGTTIEDPTYRAEVEETLAKVVGVEGVGRIASFYTTGSPAFVSDDRTATYAVVGFNGTEAEMAETMEAVRPLLTSDQLQVQLGGAPAITQEIQEQVERDLARAESLTFPILAVLLIFIFGSLIAAALPLAVGGVVILGGFLVLRFASDWTDISVFAINIITMLGLGLAIDYSLFIISRFREEMAGNGGDVHASIVRTMQTAGRTIFFSGLTVAISLLSLMVFPQQFLKSMGMGGTAAVMVAMIASVTVLPAILALLGKRVNSLSVRGILNRVIPGRRALADNGNGTAKEEKQGFWYRLSMFVMRRPAAVLIATLIPLIVAGIPFLGVKLSVADARALPPTAESRVVSERLDAEFSNSETTPIQPFVTFDRPANSRESLAALYDYTRRLEDVPGVKRVASLVNLDPAMTVEQYAGFYSAENMARDPQAAAAFGAYAKDNYSVVNVLHDYDVGSDEAQDLARTIRKVDVPVEMKVQVGGFSAVRVDFLASLGGALPYALLLIVGVIFILLFLMLGSVVVPLKAVILNILSLSVSFGALVWIFQDGNLSNLLGFTSLGSIEGSQPILIFAIAFGLSMDYEVFLLSRIKEHYDRTGDNTASVALGVQKTGTIITSAALLLVMVFAGFATGDIVFIKMVGIGLALAVLVDATLVRMLLVPATMRLLGDYNWWAPRPLKTLYRKLGLSEGGDERPASPAAGGRKTNDDGGRKKVAAPEAGA